MKLFEFTIIASGLDHEADDFEDRFFEAGCDDATIGFSRGVIILEFGRDAKDLSSAIDSAIADVRKAGAHVERVEPDYLVSISDIAERAGLTRAAISNYANGDRGRNFPAPVARVSTGSPLWNWVEIAEWLASRQQISASTVVEARTLKRINDRLHERKNRRRVA